MRLYRLFLFFSGLGMLSLASCSLFGGGSLPATTEPPIPSVIPITPALPTEPSTDLPSGAIDPCLVGDWKLVDVSAYMITSMESAGIPIEYEFSSGEAFYVFSTDGLFLLQANQYTQNFVLKSVTDVPITISLDGVGSANYSASEGRVEFTNMSSPGLVFEVTVFDETESLDFWALDDPSATSVFLYECIGTDTLHLTPPINDYAVFPVILQRNR